MLILVGILVSGSLYANTTYAYVKGIYITQSSAQNSRKMNYLIKQARAVGINTFVIDYNYRNSRYARNVTNVKRAGIHYVARIVVYPHGANDWQVKSNAYRDKIWRKIKQAIDYGAQEIQLDYIRYKASRYPSVKNAHDIHKVIQYFHHKLQALGIKLQIDIFGIATLKPSLRIGHNVRLFANSVDAICPMVYPSHYEPFRYHARRPYETVLKSVSALRHELKKYPQVKIYAYIELFNYRYPMSRKTKIKYILSQIHAARDAGANGWYAWSAGNKYNLLFSILRASR